MFLYIYVIFTFLIGSTFNIPVFSPADDKINYELLGGGFEGDMILPDGFDPARPLNEKGVASYGPRRWPNNIIPYDISLITNAAHRTMIEEAMNTLMNTTSRPIVGSIVRKPCITFQPKTSSDQVYLKIQYGTGCSATIGYSTGEKRLTLANPGCFRSGTIQHELIHVLGFRHEQSRPDRDSYITINYGNIELGKEHNFNKYTWGETVLNQNSPYDLGSIMHYGATTFSSNGQPTIIPKQTDAAIGQREKLSGTDIDEIRAFYDCSS